ncbi:hypothetical protein C8R44DRAFT_739016 [Mycena epipterygia]|nr:hypothetical protein C8R44DRAFT_739016 [Mycena epipterygia]
MAPLLRQGLSSTLLDSIVFGPNSQLYFRVSTASRPLRYTAIHDSTNEAVTVIKWLKQPVIKIRDVITKRAVSQWLVLSSDKKFISTGLEAPRIYARIFRDDNSLALDLTTEAIKMGLLDVCVAAALVLQSGLNID